MNVSITGFSGFVGTYLRGYFNSQVKCIKINRKDDLNEKFQNSHAVINLAGKAHDLKKVIGAEEYYQANTNYSNQLYDAFLKSDASVFITISSVKAIADLSDELITELTEPNPKTHYGKSKLMAEYYINSKQIPKGKRVYILRPSMIHGPGNKGNLNLLYQVIKKGFPWPLAIFENKRSFCSIENVCFVINEMIERDDIPSGIYNIADDEALSTNQVIGLIGESTGQRVRLWRISKSLIQIVANLGNLFHLPLNSDRLQKLTESYVVSNTKLIQAIGKSLPVSAKEGLRSTLRSFHSKAR
jgi:nucleoside-diphosphate-sugar epimerase